jgi:hypothetical protein
MSNRLRLTIVFTTVAVIVALVLLGTYGNSFFNSGVSSIVTQPTPTPETSTLTPTLTPTPTSTITPSPPTPTPTITPSPTLIPVPIDFTCNAGSAYAFTVTVAVDLDDGMNQAEAITVAEAIFNHEMANATYEVNSANDSNAGIWTVYLSWGAIYPDGTHEVHTHYFNVVIDPLNRTITYSRCY